MVGPDLVVLEPGLQTTVQDWPGRVGYWRVGIPPSGPMDALAFRLANLLVGNEPGVAGLEIQFLGPTLRFSCDADIALTGGSGAPTLDGATVPMWRTVAVRAGQALRCGPLRTGARAYLAIGGGIAKDALLGSAATFARGGVGGRALIKDDRIALQGAGAGRVQRQVKPSAIPAYSDEATIEVTCGPHFDWLNEDGHAAFLAQPWRVTPHSDRTGVRLAGPAIGFARRAREKSPENGREPTNVINTGYPIGGVNLCGETPIILPVDGPSQGGFITPFVVISSALWKVGQMRPNQTLRFQHVTLADAIARRRAFEQQSSIAAIEEGAPTAG
jgi:5-oxoprolinase (ATP-hydrolysing) subunit C